MIVIVYLLWMMMMMMMMMMMIVVMMMIMIMIGKLIVWDAMAKTKLHTIPLRSSWVRTRFPSVADE